MKVLIGSDKAPTKRLSVRWLWEPRDMWIGVFWNFAQVTPFRRYLLVYVGIIPCLPIAIAIRVHRTRVASAEVVGRQP